MVGTLRNNLVRLLAATALLASQGCDSGSGAKPAPVDYEEQEEMDGGDTLARLDGGRLDGGADAGPLTGPLIEVLSPIETDDPASPEVVAGATLTVRCAVKRNPKGELVDPKSVKVSIYSNADTKAAVSQVATATGEADVYQAENISLASVPHGAIRVACSASDVATKVQQSEVSIFTLYDQGPKVTFLSPVENGFVSVTAAVIVRFRVEPQPLGDADDGAAIAEVLASVGGKPIASVEKSTTEENVYSFPLDFKDTQLFTAIPKTLSVRVDATNSRAKARTTTANVSAGVDAEGPTIVIKSPARIGGQDPVVSGKVDVLMEVKDTLAGVNPGTVQIQIQRNSDGSGNAPGSDIYPAQSLGDGSYVASFETGTYVGRPRITITLLAKDNVGIAAESSLTVDVDTVPPWISLDPPVVRELTTKSTGDECSGPFDPLGDAVNDGAVVVGDAYRVRALIWDRPLTAENQTSSRYAMVDNTTTRLYIQHNTAIPLLIDSDQDPNHECDKVNVNLENATQAPTTIVLSPVKSAGAPPPSGSWVQVSETTYTFTPDMTQDPVATGMCTTIAATLGSPMPLSSDTSMTRVIKHVATGNYDVVYADSPTTSGLRSTGVDYYPAPGWACIVAAAKDNAGNFGFSPPMKVCAQRLGYTCDPTPPSTLTCTDGCVIPSKFLAGAPGSVPRFLKYVTN